MANEQSQKGSVLVVEDDKFLRDLLVNKLKDEGFTVGAVTDGKEAYEYLDKELPGVIVLDLILPDLNGFDILERITKDARTKDIPVIVLSNLDQKEDIDKAMSLGAVDFMIKANFSLTEILARIKKQLIA
ncbi:MAG: response regulator [bacterium]|nr:response regulator [bacterium]